MSGITGTVAGIADPTFSYDGNGNLASGLGRAFAWTAANLPASIDRLAAGAAVERSEFLYAPDRERVRQIRRAMNGAVPGAVSRSIFYGGAIEKEIVFAANQTVIRTYMPEGIGFVEETIAGTAVAPSASGTASSRHFHRDRQGSLLVVTDFAGAVLQRFSYDAWGRRRHNDGTDDAWSGLGTLANDYDRTGYTGQEHLDALGLVHLNGRVYDPLIGRMTSADPLVPDEDDPQAFNRYSYVLNSPLGYVDPTGFEPAPANSNDDVYEGPARWTRIDVMPRVVVTPSRLEIELARHRQATVEALLTFTPIGDGHVKLLTWGFNLSPTQAATASLILGAVDPRRWGLWALQKAVKWGRSAAKSAAAAEREATGFLGRAGNELKNAPYQKVRNEATQINGRDFSGYALDQMQNRVVMPSVVENALSSGTQFPTRAGTNGFYDAVNNSRVIVNSETGRVVTVIRGAP